MRKAEAIGGFAPAPADVAGWAKLDHPDELAMGIHLARWPDVLEEATSLREPHRIVFYVQELARDFQSYFTRMKADPVLPRDSVREDATWAERWDHEKTVARLGWIRAIRAVYASALAAIGVSAPERMDLPQTPDDEA